MSKRERENTGITEEDDVEDDRLLATSLSQLPDGTMYVLQNE